MEGVMAPSSGFRLSEGQDIFVLAASSHLLTVTEWPAFEQEWPSPLERIRNTRKVCQSYDLGKQAPFMASPGLFLHSFLCVCVT